MCKRFLKLAPSVREYLFKKTTEYGKRNKLDEDTNSTIIEKAKKFRDSCKTQFISMSQAKYARKHNSTIESSYKISDAQFNDWFRWGSGSSVDVLEAWIHALEQLAANNLIDNVKILKDGSTRVTKAVSIGFTVQGGNHTYTSTIAFPVLQDPNNDDCIKWMSFLKMQHITMEDRLILLRQLANGTSSLVQFRSKIQQMWTRGHVKKGLIIELNNTGHLADTEEETLHVSCVLIWKILPGWLKLILATLQAALATRDVNGNEIPGACVFQTTILPDICQFADCYTSTALTQKDLYKDFGMHNTSFRSITLLTQRLMAEGTQCRKDGRKIDRAAPARQQDVAAPAAAVQLGRQEAVLAWSEDFQVHEITHYRLEEETGIFHPVLNPRVKTVWWRSYKGHCKDMLQKEAEFQLNGLSSTFFYLDVPWGYHKDRNEDKDPPSPEELADIVATAIKLNRHELFNIVVSCSVQQLSGYEAVLSALKMVAGVHQVVWLKRGQHGENIPAQSGSSICRDIENMLVVHVDKRATEGKKPKEEPAHFPAGKNKYMRSHPTLHPQNMRFQTLKAGYVPNCQKHHYTKSGQPPQVLNYSEKSQDYSHHLVCCV